MRKIKFKITLVSLTSIAMLLLVLLLSSPAISHVSAQSPGTNSSLSASPSGQILVDTHVDPHYSIFDLNEVAHVNVNVSLTSLDLTNGTTPISFVSSFKPDSITAKDSLLNGTVLDLPVTAISGTYASSVGYYIYLPSNTQNVSVAFSGTEGGESILWRYVGGPPSIYMQGMNIPVSYNSVLTLPHGSIISQMFTHSENFYHTNSLPAPAVLSSSPQTGTSYSISGPVNTIVIQSTLFVPVSIAITAMLLVLLFAIAFGLTRSGRRFFGTVLDRLHMTAFLSKVSGLVASLITRIERLFVSSADSQQGKAFRSLFNSRNMLVLFVICGFLMISLASVTGPDPQPKAYVIAAPSELGHIHNMLDSIYNTNVQMVTPSQDYSDFNVMSSVGMFNVVVISNYPAYAVPEVAGFIVPNLINVPFIIVDNTANANLTAQVNALYSRHVVTVGNAGNMTAAEIKSAQLYFFCCAQPPHSMLGISVSQTSFRIVLRIEALLSFLLVFFGWAFLGLRVAEPSSETTIYRLVSIIGIGLFVFFFSETVYVATSSILTFPLSLHAVVSGAKDVTAVGLLGFGGGSTPRMLAGAGGLLIGALAEGWRIRFSTKSLIFLLTIFGILLANPLSIGSFVFQGILLFVGGIPFGTAYLSSLSLKSFVYGIGSWLGGSITPTYLMSAGKILAFAGLIPLALINKMGKVTATLALLFSLPVLGHGAARVGEMTPLKTAIAVMPGLITGFAFAFIFLLIAVLEKYLTTRYAKS